MQRLLLPLSEALSNQKKCAVFLLVTNLCPICCRCVWEVPVRIPHWVGKHTVLCCGAHWHLAAPRSLYRHSGCFSWSPEPRDLSPDQTRIQAYRWQNLEKEQFLAICNFNYQSGKKKSSPISLLRIFSSLLPTGSMTLRKAWKSRRSHSLRVSS